MNAGRDGTVTTVMNDKPIRTPKKKEIQTIFARGKTPETIAIRLGMKLSKVLLVIAMVPKPLASSVAVMLPETESLVLQFPEDGRFTKKTVPIRCGGFEESLHFGGSFFFNTFTTERTNL